MLCAPERWSMLWMSQTVRSGNIITLSAGWPHVCLCFYKLTTSLGLGDECHVCLAWRDVTTFAALRTFSFSSFQPLKLIPSLDSLQYRMRSYLTHMLLNHVGFFFPLQRSNINLCEVLTLKKKKRQATKVWRELGNYTENASGRIPSSYFFVRWTIKWYLNI